MYVSSHCHVLWDLKKSFESLLKGPTEGKTISVLRKSDRVWPHAENHMLSISLPCDVCWEENHKISEENIVPKEMLCKRESIKPEDLQKWMLDLNISPCDILKIEFSILFSQQRLGFLNRVSLKMFIFTSSGGSLCIWWYPCVGYCKGLFNSFNMQP